LPYRNELLIAMKRQIQSIVQTGVASTIPSGRTMPGSKFRILVGAVVWWSCLAFLGGGLCRAQGFGEVNPPARVVKPETVALVGARIIDATGRTPIERGTLIVEGNKIAAIGSSEQVTLPEDCERIDLAGKTIIPGFIDCHFHSINDLGPPRIFLRHGVTSLRDPGHPFRYYETVLKAREPMPRVFLCGGHIDGSPPIWPEQASVANDAESAAQIVRSHKAKGATAIKVYFRLPIDLIRAVCVEAERQELPVTAHLELVKAVDAINAGVVGIEHATSFGTSLTESDSEVQSFVDAVSKNPSVREELRYRLWSKLDLASNSLVEPVIEKVVRSSVFVSPTLAVHERRSDMPDVKEFEVLGFANMLDFVGRCHQAGAVVVAGSHTWVPGAEFGWAFQRELELLVEAGMTPMQALIAGTASGAKFLKISEHCGTLEAGKYADLIVLNENPLKDISATRSIHRVMLDGQWLEEPSRQSVK
jgi:hypothetical protein